jgi:hypothetical protein
LALGISLRCLRDKIRHFRAERIDIPEARPGPFFMIRKLNFSGEGFFETHATSSSEKTQVEGQPRPSLAKGTAGSG